MKKSELKQYIKEQIISVLSEAEAYELTGTTGNKTVTSFKSKSEADKFKQQNPNIKQVNKLEEEEEEEDTWYKSEEDSFVEKEPTAKELKKNSSMVKLQSKYAEVTKQMKSLVNKYKQAEGEEKTKVISQLKDLTKVKKELEAMINPSIGDDED